MPEDADRWEDLSLVVTDDKGIREANRAYLQHDSATDVVSLAFTPIPGSDALSGEIIVNAQRAIECAEIGRWSGSQELALYIAHGCDHIAGEEDATPVERRRMRRRELRWLRDPKIRTLALSLFVENEAE